MRRDVVVQVRVASFPAQWCTTPITFSSLKSGPSSLQTRHERMVGWAGQSGRNTGSWEMAAGRTDSGWTQ